MKEESKKEDSAKLMLNEKLENDEKLFSLCKENRMQDAETSTVKKSAGNDMNMMIIEQKYQMNTRHEINEDNVENNIVTQYAKVRENAYRNIEAQTNNTDTQSESSEHTIKGSNAEAQYIDVNAVDQMNIVNLHDERVIKLLENTKYTHERNSMEGNETYILKKKVTERHTNRPLTFSMKNNNLEQKLFPITEESNHTYTDVMAYEINDEITDGRKYEKFENTINHKHLKTQNDKDRHVTCSNISSLHIDITSKPETEMVEYTSKLGKCEDLYVSAINNTSSLSFQTNNANLLHDMDYQRDTVQLVNAEKKINYAESHSEITCKLNVHDMGKNEESHVYKSDYPTCSDNSKKFYHIQNYLENCEYPNTNSDCLKCMKEDGTQKIAHRICVEKVTSYKPNITNEEHNSLNMLVTSDNSPQYLQVKEKKLAMLHLNAMNYDKEYTSDRTEVLDEREDLDHNEPHSDTNEKIEKTNILVTNDDSSKHFQMKDGKSSLLYINTLDYEKEHKNDKRGILDETEDANHNKPYSDTNEIIKKANIWTANADSSQNLQIKEKKLSLLYINALNYEKECKSGKTGILDERGYFNCDESYSAMSCSSKEVKNLSCNSVVDNKSNFTEDFIEIDNQPLDIAYNFSNVNVDVKDFNIDSDKNSDGIKIIEDLLKQQYEAAGMKCTGDQFQINNKKTITNNVTEHYIQKNILADQDEEGNTENGNDKGESLNHSSLDDSLHTKELDNKSTGYNELTNRKFSTDEYQRESHFQDADEIFLITAMNCFKTDDIRKNILIHDKENTTTKESMTGADESINVKKEEVSCYDAEDNFEMDDDFILTESQLTMIDRNMSTLSNTSHEVKNSYQQTDDCSHTQFGLDSVTVEIINQLSYIRESVESIKELLSTAFKKE